MEISMNVVNEGTIENQQVDYKAERKNFSKIGFRLFVSSIIMQMIAPVIVGMFFPGWNTNTTLSTIVTMISLFIIGYPIMIFLLKKIDAKAADRLLEKKNMSILEIIKAFAMGYGILVAGNMIGLAITAIIGLIKGGDVVNPFAEMAMGVDNIALLAVYTVILAPVFEEIVFRKMLIDRTIKYGEGIAVVFSGVTFALFHGNFNQFIYALPMGMFLAFIYVKTANVKYTIILHMAVNFVGSILGNLLTRIFDNTTTVGAAVINVYSIVVLVIAAVGVFLFIFCRKKLKLNTLNKEISLEKGKRFKTVAFNLGMILYSIFFIILMVALLFV